MTDRLAAREEARFILETLRHNAMPDAARQWLRKRFLKLLLNSIGEPIP